MLNIHLMKELTEGKFLKNNVFKRELPNLCAMACCLITEGLWVCRDIDLLRTGAQNMKKFEKHNLTLPSHQKTNHLY